MRAAISNRDASYDSVFVYGVITTGVFCLPSCAARSARPENLRFFFSPEQAQAAGLRACKRCKPLAATHERALLEKLAQFIIDNAEQTLTLKALAERAAMSPVRLQRRFVARFGVSPKALHSHARNNDLRSKLKAQRSVTDSIFAAGFGSVSRIYDTTAQSLGMTPSAYRAGAVGEEICYAASQSSLGWLLLAATQQGVCFAQFGENESEPLDQLREEFPQAKVTPSNNAGSAQLQLWWQALDAHLSDNAPRPDVPLDLRGTAFQILVWKFLLRIEYGKTVSYGDVATGVARPKAIRAAASACGANRIAVLVPCHRVLRGDGELGGYRWGVQRKRQLLDRELEQA